MKYCFNTTIIVNIVRTIYAVYACDSYGTAAMKLSSRNFVCARAGLSKIDEFNYLNGIDTTHANTNRWVDFGSIRSTHEIAPAGNFPSYKLCTVRKIFKNIKRNRLNDSWHFVSNVDLDIRKRSNTRFDILYCTSQPGERGKLMQKALAK